jgi:hypothetical protein
LIANIPTKILRDPFSMEALRVERIPMSSTIRVFILTI